MWTIWQKDGDGVSVRQAYCDAINHTYEWAGHKWRIRAESNTVLVVERDGIEHRVKVVLNARTYGNVEYQIQKTQVKLLRYGVAWLVAELSSAFRSWDDGTWWWGNERWPKGINASIARDLESLWEIRPLKAA